MIRKTASPIKKMILISNKMTISKMNQNKSLIKKIQMSKKQTKMNPTNSLMKKKKPKQLKKTQLKKVSKALPLQTQLMSYLMKKSKR